MFGCHHINFVRQNTINPNWFYTAFSKENVVCDVPQGSALSPLLFFNSMFMTSIAPLKSLIFTCLLMTLKLDICGERSINQSRNSHH